ncbi:MAG: 30S ribosomal protein S12 methylthiotransferase RimO [Chloroflexi bacterium]|nr:30S ribosomal protein S12 methylthiotransferase RimO [Anaerolineaceae bacterium]NMB88495.1 30S ribosomal protein S12 methylthiotransferase RimO [Chloroflexota bacterium]
MSKKTYYLVSLGCAKNTVDSHSMAALLDQAGYKGVDQPVQAEVLVVNTCGFIKPAADESISVLKDLGKKKRRDQLLIAAGCLTERYREKIVELVPAVDGIIGTRRWMDIVDVIQQTRQERPQRTLYHLPDTPTVGVDETGVLRAARQGGSAYIKIADGCRRPCAFCAIPLIKGKNVSRPVDAILSEARLLQEQGVQEIILIAQDTTDYGQDLGLKEGLAHLLERLVTEVPEIPWVRILYAYPGYVTDRLIDVMAAHPQILPYLDMPLQHAHPQTLRRMRRPANMDWVYRTLDKMRTRIPGLALRTTFIVGYPGETDEEYQTLLDFIQAIRFDHVGAFMFSFEPGTTSEALGDPVSAALKQERMEQLMLLQQNISLANNQALVGKTLDVLVEGYNDGISVGRSYRDAPEIDGLVFLDGQAPVGEIVKAQISGALTHDLTGTLIPMQTQV